jgi:hypothetical protein
MGSMSTGEMYSQEQYDAMTERQRDELQLVPLTPAENAVLAPMTNEQRKTYLVKHKSRRVVNKRERQNKRKARALARR